MDLSFRPFLETFQWRTTQFSKNEDVKSTYHKNSFSSVFGVLTSFDVDLNFSHENNILQIWAQPINFSTLSLISPSIWNFGKILKLNIFLIWTLDVFPMSIYLHL